MDTFAEHPLAVRIGSAINCAYQEGGDAETLRRLARSIRETFPEHDRESFTDSIEMCGLWLDTDPSRLAAQDDPRGEADR